MTTERKEIDPVELQRLLDIAIQAQEDYWDAVRCVEQEIGLDCDEMDLCTDDIATMDAESLIKSVEHYWKEDAE